MDWHKNLVTDDAEILEICRGLTRVAVLGIKPEREAAQPAHYVPEYLARAGIEVVPVPVYYPDAKEILGKPVVRRVVDAGPVDAVDVFRRPRDLMPHAADLIAARPPVVWLQLGITDRAFEETLAKEGIRVVANRCLMVDHRRAVRS